MSLPVGEWMHSHELFDDATVERHPFYQEFMIPHGARYLSGTKLYEDALALVLFGASRHASAAAQSEDMEVLDRIKLHLVRAMQNYVYLGSTFGEPGAAKRLLNHFQYPMFLVDEQRHIRFRNSCSRKTCSSPAITCRRRRASSCRDPEGDAALLTVIRSLDLSAKSGLRALPSRKFARLKRANGAPVGLFAVAIRPDTLGAFGQQPVALLIFHNPREQAELDGFIVAEMFDLSPAEAKVAVALARREVAGRDRRGGPHRDLHRARADQVDLREDRRIPAVGACRAVARNAGSRQGKPLARVPRGTRTTEHYSLHS